MKASLIFVASALTQVALTAPFADHGHHVAHFKRNNIVYVTKTIQAPQADIVYVDSNGASMATNHGSPPNSPAPAQPTNAVVPPQPAPGPANYAQAPAPPKNAPPPQQYKPAPQQYAPAPVTASPAAPPAQTAAPSQGAPASSSPGAAAGNDKPSGDGGLGIVYSPYHADGSCKSKDQVAKDFAPFKDFEMVRSYGTDCEQVPNMIAAAKNKNMKIMLGVFDIKQVSNEVNKMIEGVGNDWSMVTAVSVGNELVKNSGGGAMVQPVIQALNTARGMLNTKFKGPIVTVDTVDALTSFPDLCHNSDFAAANAHAFFDPHADPKNAGQWLQGTVGKLQGTCGKKVVITETGWPTVGGCNSNACPSQENQKAALDSIKGSFKSDVILFSAYNDRWKKDSQDTYGCEKFWGMMGDSSN